ncbi:hypothetical protein POL68_19880 [Stigmatella sp. ncwal1]|uniref:Uncharacterized protein n=1 Tax=Stigmatella ashevillensis TaxID=2995309 RepID=A0ABT5DEK4_9BACT|nr:hypothetical protein [Stigmatella ashevillena]MDC0710747.1 hypothetical protein [Stigmatella ashevillena]
MSLEKESTAFLPGAGEPPGASSGSRQEASSPRRPRLGALCIGAHLSDLPDAVLLGLLCGCPAVHHVHRVESLIISICTEGDLIGKDDMMKRAVLVFAVGLAASTSAHAQFAIGGFDRATDNGFVASYEGWACSTSNPAQTQQLISIVIEDGAGRVLAQPGVGTSVRQDVAQVCGGNALVGWSTVAWGTLGGVPLYAIAVNNQTGARQPLNTTPLYSTIPCNGTFGSVRSCCSLAFSSSSVPAGATVTLALSSWGYIPAGSISYLYGTRNGVPDEFGSPYYVTSGNFSIVNSPGLSGSYERRVTIVGPYGETLCNSPSTATVFQ